MSKSIISSGKKILMSELQAESWTKDSVLNTPLDQQIKHFSLQNFQENILYVQKTGFDEVYLWGVEWWYYMAKQGYPQYLEYAKTLF